MNVREIAARYANLSECMFDHLNVFHLTNAL